MSSVQTTLKSVEFNNGEESMYFELSHYAEASLNVDTYLVDQIQGNDNVLYDGGSDDYKWANKKFLQLVKKYTKNSL